jgi:cytochrome c biogenesis protein CcmG/thiol:disulfide interchange protein DsbE
MSGWVLSLLLACASVDVAPREGRVAPEISGVGLDGQAISLGASRGRPVLLVFWASWCAPCRAEAPQIAAIARAYGDRIHVLSVNAGESIETVAATVPGMGIAGQVVLDPKGVLRRSYEVQGIPLVLVVDAQGVVRYRGNGIPSDIHRLLDGLTS